MDRVPTNTHSSQGESQLFIFEDNETVIKMIIKGRSPTMTHLSRTHSVTLDWLLDRINLEPKIQIKYVDTQLADMLTKGSFTRDDWNHLLRLFNVMNFSMFSCSYFSYDLCDPIGKQSAMSKRGQEATSSEFSPMAKPKPMIPAKSVECEEEPSARSQRSSQSGECRRGGGGEGRGFSVCVCARCAVCDLFRRSSEIGQNKKCEMQRENDWMTAAASGQRERVKLVSPQRSRGPFESRLRPCKDKPLRVLFLLMSHRLGNVLLDEQGCERSRTLAHIR